MMKKIEFTPQQRLTHALMLNAGSMLPGSLMNGQAGIVLYMYHAGRQAADSTCTAFAEDLLDEIMQSMHTGVQVDFNDGLIGFAWLVEHLIASGLVEADRDDILEEMDIMVHNKSYHLDRDSGLIDLFIYYGGRLDGDRSLRDPARIAALTAAFEAVLGRMCAGGDWLEEAVRGRGVFDILWPFPWMIYYAMRLQKQGYASPSFDRVVKKLDMRLKSQNNADLDPRNFLLLTGVLGVPPVESLVRRCIENAERCQTYELAWLIMVLYLFYREPCRTAILELGGLMMRRQHYDDSPYAGFGIDEQKVHFAYGLHKGLAAVGLAALLMKKLEK